MLLYCRKLKYYKYGFAQSKEIKRKTTAQTQRQQKYFDSSYALIYGLEIAGVQDSLHRTTLKAFYGLGCLGVGVG